MPISRYCATQFNEKYKGYIYTLRHPYSGEIFYVGKTIDPKARFWGHLSGSYSRKEKYIQSLKLQGYKPTMAYIEIHKIRTNYDRYYYDYREFFFIKSYLNYGWDLTNERVDCILSSEIEYKKIVNTAKEGGELHVSDFYYNLDFKGFPIYDLKKINKLGYNFSKEQFASHWAYLIDVEKYANINESTHDYIYDDDILNYRQHNPPKETDNCIW